MIRFFYSLFQIAVVVALALWLADSPGSAHIVWHDTVIETSAAFLALCALLLAYAIHLLFRLWHVLRHGPTHWRLRRLLNKVQKSHDHLTDGLIALASGHASEAGRLAITMRKGAENNVAALWLQAQAAQLAGDTGAAREIFRKLAAHPKAAVLGYRGLITEAKKQNDWNEVDQLLTELHRLKPATPWLSLIRMESAARRGQWAEAESAVAHAVTARLMDTESGKRNRASLRIAASREAAAAGNNDSALQAAEQAVRYTPDWLPALINLAERLAATNNRRAAQRLIERAWKTQPHPQLAQILRGLYTDALEAFKQTERLCRLNEAAPESHLALAEAALNADIWGEARRHLVASVNTRVATQNIYKLLARLERRERSDERAASLWLTKSSEAATDPTWSCRACGYTHAEWHPTCMPCGNFDTLEWHSAGTSRGIAARPTGE